MQQQTICPVTLTELRNELKLTQRKLANLLSNNPEGINFSQALIASYELGIRTPSLKRAKLIAKYFDVPVEAIIFSKTDHESQSEMKLTGTGGN